MHPPRRHPTLRTAAAGAAALTALVLGWPGTLLAQRVTPGHAHHARGIPLAGAGGGADHYFAEQLSGRDSVARRWPERTTHPIRIWIQPLDAECVCTDAYPAAVREALREWDAIGLPVRFAEVRDSSVAELHVLWSERLGRDESGRAVWWSTPDGWITRVRLTIRTHSDRGALLPQRDVRAVALHELGHALGLGHVADTRHIMSEWIEATELSDADRRTAAMLYGRPAGRVAASTLAALTTRLPTAVGTRDRAAPVAIGAEP